MSDRIKETIETLYNAASVSTPWGKLMTDAADLLTAETARADAAEAKLVQLPIYLRTVGTYAGSGSNRYDDGYQAGCDYIIGLVDAELEQTP